MNSDFLKSKLIDKLSLSGLSLFVFCVVIYFGYVATDRYATDAYFVVKQADDNQVAFAGLASLGSATPSVKDALVLKEYILSRSMAVALDKKLQLKAHYQNQEIDSLSRLSESATTEAYVKFYQNLVQVHHDEMSDILSVEVQAFDPEFSLALTEELLVLSEKFINGLSDKMISEQLQYAEEEVTRSYAVLKKEQEKLLAFQEKNRSFSPKDEGLAMQQVVNNLQTEIIKTQAELKEKLVTYREDTSVIKTLRTRIESLEQQLVEERQRLASPDNESLNNLNLEYSGIELSVQLSLDLYKSSLASYEKIRSEAYHKLKHLLIVESPALAESSKYPKRMYNIVTWLVAAIVIYLLLILILAVIREHSE